MQHGVHPGTLTIFTCLCLFVGRLPIIAGGMPQRTQWTVPGALQRSANEGYDFHFGIPSA